MKTIPTDALGIKTYIFPQFFSKKVSISYPQKECVVKTAKETGDDYFYRNGGMLLITCGQQEVSVATTTLASLDEGCSVYCGSATRSEESILNNHSATYLRTDGKYATTGILLATPELTESPVIYLEFFTTDKLGLGDTSLAEKIVASFSIK